jgi:Nif-specific regulatory protein
MEMLLSYHWPGNVRELENVVERSVVLSQENIIREKDLLLRTDSPMIEESYSGKSLKEALKLFKKHFIRNVLESHGWNQTETAVELDIQRTYLSKLIKELEIRE